MNSQVKMNNGVPASKTLGVLVMVGLLAAALVLAGVHLVSPGSGAKLPVAASQKSAEPGIASVTMTDAQLRQWQKLTDSPRERERVMRALAASFDGVAKVSLTDPRAVVGSASAASTMRTVADVEPVLAYGYNGHFWITASYA